MLQDLNFLLFFFFLLGKQNIFVLCSFLSPLFSWQPINQWEKSFITIIAPSKGAHCLIILVKALNPIHFHMCLLWCMRNAKWPPNICKIISALLFISLSVCSDITGNHGKVRHKETAADGFPFFHFRGNQTFESKHGPQ